MSVDEATIYAEENRPQTARSLLAGLHEVVFSGKTGELAAALGRETDEILDILEYDEEVDEELFVIMHRLFGRLDWPIVKKDYGEKVF